LSENSAKQAAVQGTLRERPFPRLLQQLYRKKFTGYFVVADQTRDESEVYLRDGSPVHVCRPVDTDRLGNLLVEYGVVPAEIVAAASAEVTEGMRLGDILERMGALNKQTLAQVLKSQVVRKLIRLFFIVEGTYAIYVTPHAFGEGADLPLMRVDPRSVIYPGIRAAYDLPRVTQELTRLLGLRFRLQTLSSAFIAAMGVPPDDPTVEALRKGWMMLDDLDAVTSRPLEVRSVVLALYYADLLEREPIAEQPAPVSDSAIPRPVHLSQSSELGAGFKLPGDSGPAMQMAANAASPPAPPGIDATAASGTESRRASAASSSSGERPLTAAASTRPSGIFDSVRSRPIVAPASAVVVPTAPQELPMAGLGTPSAAGAGTPMRAQPVSPAPGPSVPVVRGPMVSPMRFDAKPPQAAPTKSAGAAHPAQASIEATRANIQDMAQKLGKATHFELLGVGQNASSDEVGTAFVRAARQFHPDRLVSAGLQDLQPLAEKILARINEATMVLGDATRRAEYIASLAAGPQAARTTLPTLLEAENMFLKGEVFLKKGEHAKAVECFTHASQGNPGEPQYRAFLAWARFEDPNARKDVLVRDTLKTMEEVVRERPKFARGFYWVGLLWKFLNEADKAGRAFREAVNLDASFIEAGRELRLIEMRKSKSSPGKPGAKPEASRGGLMGKLFKK
jgi:curved DNA-binding protein CbpA